MLFNAKPSPVTPLSFETETAQTSVHYQDMLDSKARREQRFLRGLALIMLVGYAISFLAGSLPSALSSNNNESIIFICLEIGGASAAAFSYWCSRQLSRVQLGGWVLIGYTNLAVWVSIISETSAHVIPAGIIINVILSLFVLPWIATLGFGLGGIICTCLVYLAQIAQYPQQATGLWFELLEWILILFISITISIFLSIQLRRAHQLVIQQTQRLNQALALIEGKRQVGQSVSERIYIVTSELNAAATQQASGSQQQVSILVEVTDFLQELSQTAGEVANRAEAINLATVKVLASASQVKETTEQAVQIGQQGTEVVKQTIDRNQQVKLFYQELMGRLNQLQVRSASGKRVLSLMQSISAEIHLLALNAAIEAAGAGEYGDRFRVVAAEVKGLANRSVQASQEVNTILGQIESQIQEAVTVAEEGQEHTDEAVNIAEQSGKLLDQLSLAIDQSATEVETIEQAIATMEKLTAEINQATNQQRSASFQAVEKLHEVGLVARQSASGSMEFINTAQDLESLSQELTKALAA